MLKRIVLILGLALVSSGCQKSDAPVMTAVAPPPHYSYAHQLKIGGKILMVEIANTDQQRQQGLSDQTQMADNKGMLFDFGSQLSNTAFWMKDMKFNLDFIWIAQNKVVGITSDVPHPGSASDPLPSYYSPSPVNQVVEVNAGWTKKNNISAGDAVLLQ